MCVIFAQESLKFLESCSCFFVAKEAILLVLIVRLSAGTNCLLVLLHVVALWTMCFYTYERGPPFLYVFVCACLCIFVCVFLCKCVCVHACACVCVWIFPCYA